MDKNSFIEHIRKEIYEKDFGYNAFNYLLKGFAYNFLSDDNKNPTLISFETKNDISYNFFNTHLNKYFENKYKVDQQKTNKSAFKKCFTLTFFSNTKKDFNFENLNKNQIKYFFTGLFLNSGSINNPTNGNYHLQIRLKTSKNNQNLFFKFESNFNIKFNKYMQKNAEIFYIKKGDYISDFLKIIDVEKTLFSFEDERIKRDYSNSITRLNNIDVSNINKTVISNLKIQKAINYIFSKPHLLLDFSKKEIYLFEKKQKLYDFSYSELSVFLNKSSAYSYTKSFINHSFRKLLKKIKDCDL